MSEGATVAADHEDLHALQLLLQISAKHGHLPVVAGPSCLDNVFRVYLELLRERLERVKVHPLLDRVKLP